MSSETFPETSETLVSRILKHDESPISSHVFILDHTTISMPLMDEASVSKDELPPFQRRTTRYAHTMGRNGFASHRKPFPATRWSLVATAGTDDAAGSRALADLCQDYWIPIYGYIRRSGKARQDAEDLTQGFFEKVVDSEILTKARQDRGKLRSFLLGVLKRYLCDEFDKATAQKRGGAVTIVSLDYEEAETSYEHACTKALDPAKQYDQQWALTMLADVLDTLRNEYVENGRALLFETLGPVLTQQSLDQPYAELAETLGVTANAVKIAIYRLRQRYRELLCQRIADTVGSYEDVEHEIAHLCQLFSTSDGAIIYQPSQPQNKAL